MKRLNQLRNDLESALSVPIIEFYGRTGMTVRSITIVNDELRFGIPKLVSLKVVLNIDAEDEALLVEFDK